MVSSPRTSAAQAVTPTAELTAGDAAVRAKAYDSALAHFRAAQQASPSARAALGVADALYQLARLGEAYEAYADVLRSYPKLARADATLAAARLKDLAAKTGWVSIRLSEEGAQVDLDGASLGVSPVPALVRVAVGSHVVHVAKGGFLPFDTRAEVKADATAVVDVTLTHEATQGHVVVQTSGEPLRVLVDGVDVGPTPWEGDVPPGSHEITGRSSTAVAVPQTVAVVAGTRLAVDLVATPTAAHLQIRTSDGQGLITLDGAAKGTGAFAGDVPPGAHTLSVTRDGYKPYSEALTLGIRETRAETVTLEPVAVTVLAHRADHLDGEGVYGGFGLAWLPSVLAMGSELDTGCGTLGAASCSTPAPTAGGGIFGYAGYTWNPVGFELMIGASGDTVQQKATYNASGGASGTLPATAPARTETFTFGRAGGFGAVRVRASYSLPAVRLTAAAGLGLAYRVMLMKRDSTATDGSGLRGLYIPDPVTYLSPAVSAEAAVALRVTPTLAVAIGAEFWAENAASGTASPPSPGQKLYAPNTTPATDPTPQVHFASGPQIFLGPFLGLEFGP